MIVSASKRVAGIQVRGSLPAMVLLSVAVLGPGCDREDYRSDVYSSATPDSLRHRPDTGSGVPGEDVVDRPADLPFFDMRADSLEWPEDGGTVIPPDIAEVPEVASDQGTEETAGVLPLPCPQLEFAQEPTLKGLAYWDLDDSSDTAHDQDFDPPDDAPMGKAMASLLGVGLEMKAASCANGWFAFSSLPAGLYALELEAPEEAECTSSNRAVRFPAAVREGEVVIVTIGDSIPKFGPKPWFPARLAEMLSGLVDVDSRNVAVPGSRSIRWQPGGNYFENLLDPELADADVVLISIGGNDIMAHFGNAFYNWSKLLEKMKELDEFTDELHQNIVNIVGEIQARAPTADVVYILYFNYGKATYWQNLAGQWKALALDAAEIAFDKARKRLGDVPGLMVADVFSAFDGDNIDACLSDSVHLSDLGHEFYARELFVTLGAARVGEDPLGLDRMYGFLAK